MQARRPAPPAPMTSTSYSNVSYLAMRHLEENVVGNHAARHEANVNVGERHSEKTRPCPKRMLRIQERDFLPNAKTRLARQIATITIQTSTNQVPPGMAPERIERQEQYVEEKHNRPDADSPAINKVRGLENVVGKNEDKYECRIKRVAVEILQDEWKELLSGISRP